MKKTFAILIFLGALLAMITEVLPTNMKVHGEEAHHHPELQVEYIQDDPTGWAVANLGMGVGGIIIAVGLGLFAREVPSVSDNKNIHMAIYLGAVLAALGALVHAIIRLNTVLLPAEEILNNFNTPDWMYTSYSIFTQIAIIITGFVLIQTGYSKILGWVMIGLVTLLFFIMGDGPPGVKNLVFLIMGLTLLFKSSPSPQKLSQTSIN